MNSQNERDFRTDIHRRTNGYTPTALARGVHTRTATANPDWLGYSAADVATGSESGHGVHAPESDHRDADGTGGRSEPGTAATARSD